MSETDKPQGGGRKRSGRRRGSRAGKAAKKQQNQSQNSNQEAGSGSPVQNQATNRQTPKSENRNKRQQIQESSRPDSAAPQAKKQPERYSDRFLSIADRLPEKPAYQTNPNNQGPVSKKKGFFGPDRPRWQPPKFQAANLPTPNCVCCGKPIEDLHTAVNDKSGNPAHFDCVLSMIEESERPGPGERVVYIGGGRFALAHFPKADDLQKFQLRKIIQWEEKDKRAQWRGDIAEQYSST